MATKKKLTADEILEESQQFHEEWLSGSYSYWSRRGDQNTREKIRIKLRDRYWELREQIVSMFDTREASLEINKWLNSQLSEEEQLLLISHEKNVSTTNSTENFSNLYSQIKDLELILLTCQVAKESVDEGCQEEFFSRLYGKDSNGDQFSYGINQIFDSKGFQEYLAYKLKQLRAIHLEETPASMPKPNILYECDEIILENVKNAIITENKVNLENLKDPASTENKDEGEKNIGSAVAEKETINEDVDNITNMK